MIFARSAINRCVIASLVLSAVAPMPSYADGTAKGKIVGLVATPVPSVFYDYFSGLVTGTPACNY